MTREEVVPRTGELDRGGKGRNLNATRIVLSSGDKDLYGVRTGLMYANTEGLEF